MDNNSQNSRFFTVLVIGIIMGVAFCILGIMMLLTGFPTLFSKEADTKESTKTNTIISDNDNTVVDINNDNSNTTINTDTNNNNNTVETVDSDIESLKGKYLFDLSQIECVGDVNKCERNFKVHFNEKVHDIKVISKETQNKGWASASSELYIDNDLANKYDLGSYDANSIDAKKITGTILIFDSKYLGFLTSKYGYGGQSLELYNDNGLIKNAFSNVKTGNMVRSYDYVTITTKTGYFYEDTNETFDAKVEFDGHTLNHWCTSSIDNDNVLYKVSLTFDGSKASIKAVDSINHILGAGAGGPAYSSADNKYIGY